MKRAAHVIHVDGKSSTVPCACRSVCAQTDERKTGVVSAASGRPITVLQGTEISGTGIGNDRGTFIAGSNPYSKNSCAGVAATCVSWLNPSAFSLPMLVARTIRPYSAHSGISARTRIGCRRHLVGMHSYRSISISQSAGRSNFAASISIS